MGDHDTDRTSVRSRYDWSTIAPSTAIVYALASLENARPVQLPSKLDGSLYEYIDPEALDRIIAGKDAACIEFTVDEYDIRIEDETLEICYE